MRYEQITALLEKYWEGDTSLAEEKQLRDYFAAGSVDARLEQFAPFFQAISLEKQVEMKASARPLAMRANAGGRIFRYAVAASLAGLLGLGAWMYIRQNQEVEHRQAIAVKMNQDTFDDPEQAAEEIKAALALVSSKMRKGKKEAAKGLNKMDSVNKFIIKPKSKKSKLSHDKSI